MNIKKVMHKDRHGAQVSVEFDPSGAANPQALGVLQEFFKVAVPQMGGIPEHPGEPKGTDTVPAWLTPGEFVMNAEATRMFEPQIKQMNDAGRAVQAAQGGTIPEYHAKGGEAGGPCWDGYEMVGMKQKGGKDVPNCVPVHKADGGPIYLASGSDNLVIPNIPLDKWGNVDFNSYLDQNLVSPVEDAAINAYKAGATPEDIYKLSGVELSGVDQTYDPSILAKAADDAFGSGGPWGAIAQSGLLDPPEFIGDAVEGAIDGYNWVKDKGTQLGSWLSDKASNIKTSGVPPMSQSEVEAMMMEEEAIARSARPMYQAEIDAKRDEIRKKYAEGKLSKRQYDTQMLTLDYTTPKEKIETLKKEDAIADLVNKQERANEIGDSELVSEYGSEIDKLQGEVDTYNKKPTKPVEPSTAKPVEPSNKLKIDGVEVTEENLDLFTLKLTEAGAKAAEDPGLFKSAMNWVDENFGGILNSDDLKKMMLYYLGSRAFGNSHEGSANWVGTMFVKDAQSREALVQKLAASGKYDEKSIEKYKQTRNLGDLKAKVAVSDIGDKTTYYVNGKPMLLSKITLDNGTVYYEDEAGNQISRKSVRTSNDYNAEFDRTSNMVKDKVSSIYSTRYPLQGDAIEKSQYSRSKLPTDTDFGIAVAEYAMKNEGVANINMTNLVSNVLADMEKEVVRTDGEVDFSSSAAVEPFINAQVIRAKADKTYFKDVDATRRAELANIIAKGTAGVNQPESVRISSILDSLMTKWDGLDKKEQEMFDDKAISGQNGFYVFAMQQL